MQNELKYRILIPDQTGETEWLETELAVNTPPLTDHEIAILPYQERVATIRRQLDYQKPFVHELVGVEDNIEISPATFHLAELVFDYEDRTFNVEYLKTRYQESQHEYNQEKKTLKGKWKWKKVEKWKDEKEEWEQTILDAETLASSSADILIKDFFLMEDGIEQLELVIEDVKDRAPESVHRILTFLNFASESLGNSKIRRNPSEFKYKHDDLQIVRSRTATVLHALVERSFDTVQYLTDEKKGIQELSNSILRFYWNNAEDLLEADKVHPLITFTYDLLFASSSDLNPRLYTTVVEWLNKKIAVSQKYPLQLNSFEQKYYMDLIQVAENDFRQLESWVQEKGGLESLYTHRQELSKVSAKLSFPQRYEISEGLYSTHRFIQQVLNKKSHFLTGYEVKKLATSLDPERQLKVFTFLKLASLIYFARDSVSANVMSLRSEEVVTSHFARPEYLIEFTKELDNKEVFNMNLTGEEFLRELDLINIFTSSVTSKENLFEMYQALKAKYYSIRDNYQYFIALNGDQFIAQYDEDLKKVGINSITFYSIHSRPQNQKVVIRTQKNTTTFYISETGKLLHSTGSQTRLPLYVINKITDMLFKRLEYVTSGEAFSGEKKEETLEERETKQEREILARRSHWRKLPGNRYTLESRVAQEHIREVFEDYGINTWEEILRRRVAGTIGRDEVMTYVKAHMKPGAEPNIIKYQHKADKVES